MTRVQRLESAELEFDMLLVQSMKETPLKAANKIVIAFKKNYRDEIRLLDDMILNIPEDGSIEHIMILSILTELRDLTRNTVSHLNEFHTQIMRRAMVKEKDDN